MTELRSQKKTNEEIIKSWADEEIKKAKITILLISKKTLDRKYVSYELTKSLDNGNLIIPILIDSKENNFSEKEIESIENKLCKKFKIKKIKIRRWFQGKGKKNILRWLNKELV